MKKLHKFLLHTFIMITATLLVVTISIISLYFGLQQMVDSGALEESSINIIRTPFIFASVVALGATLLAVMLASLIYFRITQPLTKTIEQQSETFQTLVKTAHEAVFLIDVHGIIQFANLAAENLFGYDANELPGKNIKLLMPSPHREKHDSYIENYLKTGVKKLIGLGRQLIGQRKDGRQFPIYLSIGEIKLNHTHLFAGLIMDLSVQQTLQREVLAIPAREQQRIGEELHDGLGQQLTGLSMLAQSLLNNASKPEYELASQLASGLNEALAQVRALSRGLLPVHVRADGFMLSLQEITENIEKQSNIPIKLQADNVVMLFDDATASHLYRIVQESLNNAVKHAHASEISVSLKIEQDHGVLEIADDGVGLPANFKDSNGLGLHIMKHRCGLFDGEITINPAGQRGTLVCCRFPINAERDN
ncbi:MAG: PAS domain-containing sensor histidine kinase [Gammaproteobacteria bacterium]|nr:PAS domain-containing sensor histidine kinase [Gammaproteobacteria bacterium]